MNHIDLGYKHSALVVVIVKECNINLLASILVETNHERSPVAFERAVGRSRIEFFLEFYHSICAHVHHTSFSKVVECLFAFIHENFQRVGLAAEIALGLERDVALVVGDK